MIHICKAITDYLSNHLQSKDGINAHLAALRKSNAHAPHDVRAFFVQNISPELLEKSNNAAYPSVSVYCEKLNNTLREKFRTFAGTARLVVELRNSDDRLDGMDSTNLYVDLISAGLDKVRGEWLPGVFFNGSYEVTYSAVKAGGKHLLQIAKVVLEVDVSS